MSEATQRLFFALWPDAPVSDALALIARKVGAESGGRAAPPGNIHLTLGFLGDRPASVARELSVAAAQISVPVFDLVFDRVDSWRKSNVAWAGVRSVPLQLVLLHEAIGRALRANGITPDERPLAVHVTLARRISTAVRRPLAPSLAWHVDAFCLVKSELDASGARYKLLSRWPLTASA